MASKIQIVASIQSPIAKVWRYWTDPAHIVKWNFAVPEWHCPKATSDLKVGGKYYARMEAKDGSFGFDFEATYDEVVSQSKITFTMADGRKATTIFESKAGSTNVTTIFDAENQNSEEMQKNGWQSILNNFKRYVEAN